MVMPYGRIESEIVSVALGAQPSPPVDLRRVASDVGVGDVLLMDVRDGFTDFSYVRPVIYLNRADSDTRARFVLAHELAHVMLRMPQVMNLIQARGQVSSLTDEERLADRIAATLLVPDGWVEALRESHTRAKQLTDAAKLAGVSLATLVRRMATAGIDVAMLHWIKGKSNWHVIDRPGAPRSLHGSVKPSMIGHWTIENVGPEESDIVIDCQVNGKLMKISGNGLRDGSAVLQIIQPSCAVRVSRYNECAKFDGQVLPDIRPAGFPFNNAVDARHLDKHRHRARHNAEPWWPVTL